MTKKMLKIVSALMMMFIIGIGTLQAKRLTIEIKPELVDCVGVAPMKCMQIKFKKSKEWQFFYSQIEGFNFEEGHHYKLRVKRTKIKNPPADGSSFHYKLVKILSKTKVENTNKSQEAFLTKNKWTLIQFNGKTDNFKGAFIEFDAAKKQANGNTSCNNFFGAYALEGNKISFAQMGVTLMACLNDNIEREFLDLLNSKNLTYDLADQTFNIYENGKLIAIFGLDSTTK